ncbi:MAG: glutathione S-transferase family protein [Pseudomonadota bacterium]
MSKLMLHQYNLSPFNDKIQRMLNYKGIAFEEKYWQLAEQKQVRKFNPSGKLPALEHNGHLVCDSTDMAHYIEETFPEPPLLPAAPELRGLVHALEDWADESLYFYEMRWRFGTPGNVERNLPRMVEKEKPFVRWLLPKLLPKGLKKILDNQGVGRKSMEQLKTDTERHVAAVAGMLEGGDFLVGKQLTLADLAVRIMFECFNDATEGAEIIARYPAVPAWMARVEALTEPKTEY